MSTVWFTRATPIPSNTLSLATGLTDSSIARPESDCPSLLGFLRIATNTRAFRRPLTMAVAWQQVSGWLSTDTVWTSISTGQSAMAERLYAATGDIFPSFERRKKGKLDARHIRRP